MFHFKAKTLYKIKNERENWEIWFEKLFKREKQSLKMNKIREKKPWGFKKDCIERKKMKTSLVF